MDDVKVEQIVDDSVQAKGRRNHWIRLYAKHYWLLFTFIVAVLMLLAWQHRWINDDAFISYRYAENFVNGHGLVWNQGEHVEGYTNFLWTIILAGVIALHSNPALFSEILGVVCFGISLVAMFKLGRLFFRSRSIALLLVIFLGTNSTFNAFATGGLETQLQAGLLLWSAYWCINSFLSDTWTMKQMLVLSLLLTAAILTRLDSLIIVCLFLMVALLSIFPSSQSVLQKLMAVTALLLPMAILVGTWLVWKLSYYGNIFPNSFYAKVESPTSLSRGFTYLYLFAVSYILFPFFLIVLISFTRLLKRENRHWAIVALCVILWFAYIVYIGGDHMEFRFLVPVLPFIILLIGWTIFTIFRSPVLRGVLILLVFAGTLHHFLTFESTIDPKIGIAPVRQVDGEITKEGFDWSMAGRALWNAFKGDQRILIATTAAGAVPFYSELPTVDMLGINDPWVARHGAIIGTTPGHQRISPMSYLIKRKVNLLLGQPTLVQDASQITHVPLAPMDSSSAFTEATILLIPTNSQEKLVALYLTENSIIDAAIQRNDWEVIRVKVQPDLLP